jgi:transcriptional regulator
MYVPASFAPPDAASLFDAIQRYSFALLVSGSGDDLTASHLPLLLDRTSGEHGTLLGHMARANSQWRGAAGQPVLAIFSGPHAYISPTWYEAAQVVPTWNYVAVHAYGRLELIEDAAQSEQILRRTVATYEAGMQTPWQLNESPEWTLRLVAQIVAFRIPIDRLEGKWKLNQNHPAERRAKVVAALERQGDESGREIVRLMRAGDGS